MMKLKTALASIVLVAAPMLAQAAPVDGKTAESMLFDVKGKRVEVMGLPGLSDSDLGVLRQALAISAKDAPYYASVAMAPDEGMQPTSTVLAANFHSPEAADAAAVSACNGRRSGGARCVVVARTMPKDFAARPLLLSADATQAFLKDYRRARAPKAMAISPATAKWSIQTGPDAGTKAIRDCNAQAATAGAQDCELAVVD